MPVVMPANRLMMGMVSMVQREARALPQQAPPPTHNKERDAGAKQLPVEAAPAHPATHKDVLVSQEAGRRERPPTALAHPCAVHVTEGDVLGRHSAVNMDATSFHATSRYLTTSAAAGGVTALTQRAIAEYQTFAQLGKARSAPLHSVDEYV